MRGLYPHTLDPSNAELPGTLTQTLAPSDDVSQWLTTRLHAHTFTVTPQRLTELDGWAIREDGNLSHDRGGYFSVQGLHCELGNKVWDQPIINQPEVGLLGILAAHIDGETKFLLQAKMEPGNPNYLQLSPTVQATRSNYTRMHQGSAVRYLEYFMDATRGRTVRDSLQSEHGSWFHQKRNRNLIVITDDPVTEHPDFRWFSRTEIQDLMRRDLTLNMDTRSVLSSVVTHNCPPISVWTDHEIHGWLLWHRTELPAIRRQISLRDADQWSLSADEQAVTSATNRHFRIVGVRVRAGSREISGWDQPLLEPTAPGLAGLFVHSFNGVPHLLLTARQEAGTRDNVEFGPTIQATPSNYNQPFPFEQWIPDLCADPLYDAVHSEEGGRFLNACIRYVIAQAPAALIDLPPEHGVWVSVHQAARMAQLSGYLNVELRTLLACVSATPV
ncbi:NDP-hexose 2,3-dehydratase [Enemella evansiae]|uniref:NDP-hexose 2,3-dehydratase family protein n=1 Tax=Enemella evansiae TaxID=2016499 RepID=UPI000B965C60|nr:NDP-hexose 2,3-dehydratase family protein [Enemella evansiae]OYO15484.1 NDP-hexose 2,3-dehydratase [Enemella evansiae]